MKETGKKMRDIRSMVIARLRRSCIRFWWAVRAWSSASWFIKQRPAQNIVFSIFWLTSKVSAWWCTIFGSNQQIRWANRAKVIGTHQKWLKTFRKPGRLAGIIQKSSKTIQNHPKPQECWIGAAKFGSNQQISCANVIGTHQKWLKTFRKPGRLAGIIQKLSKNHGKIIQNLGKLRKVQVQPHSQHVAQVEAKWTL